VSLGPNPNFEFPPSGLTLRWFAAFFASEPFVTSLFRVSLVVGVLAAAIATLIGTAAAIAIVRFRFFGREVLETFFLTPLLVPQMTGEDAMPWWPAAIAEATTPEPQERVSPSTPRSQERTSMRLGPAARTKLTLAPSGSAGWRRRGGPKRSIASFARSPRTKTTRWGTPTFIGIAVGGRPRPEDRDRIEGRRHGGQREGDLLAVHARLDRSPAGLEHDRVARGEAMTNGIPRSAARPVGAERRGTSVGVEVVDPDAALLSGREEEGAVGADRKPARAGERQAPAGLVGQVAAIRLEHEEGVAAAGHLHETRGKGHGSGILAEGGRLVRRPGGRLLGP
jgi:hypothetical protein